jgi:diguanylate cyclase (GGDEF)-like protein
MVNLAGSRTVKAYYANEALGMSMEYGLRASLMAVRGEFAAMAERKLIGGAPVYRQIALTDPQGRLLVDWGDGPLGVTDFHFEAGDSPRLGLHRDGGEHCMHVSATVRHRGRTVGMVVASIDYATALRNLLGLTDHRGVTRLAVLTADGEPLVGSLEPGTGDRSGPGQSRPVAGGLLRLTTHDGAATGERLYSSRWALLSLLMLAFPVLAGVFFLLRMNSRNVLLKARYEASRQRREELRRQNQRLELEVAKRIDYERRLAYQANYDSLTDLPNRGLALDRLSQAIKRARRLRTRVLVMFADLDHFKRVNDSMGHQAGDRLLREAAARLSEVVREADTVARLGGDEFLLICPDIDNANSAEALAESVLEALSPPFLVDDQEFFIRASIGVALYPEDGEDAEQLLKNADVALYRAKDDGRNRFCFFTREMDLDAQKRLLLESHLRHAIEFRELRLVYQPIVAMHNHRVVGVEALLRWQSKELGPVSPAEFIPLAEDTGVIHELTRWVLEQAMHQAAAWDLDQPLRLAVNISPREFAVPGRLIDALIPLLERSRLAPGQLELELTEGMLMQDLPATSEALEHLSARGMRLSVDDFGTGYSALAYLQRYPFNTLKIDRSFVQGIENDPASAALVRSILVMARALGLETVAEGVETEAQAAYLASYGCHYAQGYLFSPPLEADGIPAFVQPPARVRA